MSKIWVVVADEAKARILSTSKSTEPLVEVQSLSSSEAYDREQDLVSDKPGRGSNGSGQGKHAMDEKTTHKEQYAIRFAKELADFLEKNQHKKTYMKLIIVAAPRFLGLMRKEMSKSVSELVSLEIDKDLTMMEPQAIREHLPQYL
jgi:protein required for attachment to host cells